MPSPPTPSSANLASFSALRTWQDQTFGYTFPEAEFRQTREAAPDGRVGKFRTPPAVPQAIWAGVRKFTDIPVPALAICVCEWNYAVSIWQVNSDPAVKTAIAAMNSVMEREVSAFEGGVPSARVVRLPHATQYVFLSNAADVLREMHAFLQTLK